MQQSTMDETIAKLIGLPPTNARTEARRAIELYNPTRNAGLSDALLLEIRDVLVDTDTADFIFEELERDVLRRPA